MSLSLLMLDNVGKRSYICYGNMIIYLTDKQHTCRLIVTIDSDCISTDSTYCVVFQYYIIFRLNSMGKEAIITLCGLLKI